MIADWFLSALFAGLNSLLSLAPTFTMPSQDAYDIGAAVVAQAGRIVPLAMAVGCLAALVTMELVLKSWDLVVFVYHQFWGSS